MSFQIMPKSNKDKLLAKMKASGRAQNGPPTPVLGAVTRTLGEVATSTTTTWSVAGGAQTNLVTSVVTAAPVLQTTVTSPLIPSVANTEVVPALSHHSTLGSRGNLPLATVQAVDDAAITATGAVKRSSLRSTSTGKASFSQRAREYALYMTQLPKLCASDRTKLKTAVEEELCFQSFKDKSLGELNLASRVGQGTPILDNFSIKTGVSLKFLHPPVLKCLLCHGNLHVHHSWNFKGKPPTQVKVHTMTGPQVYSKVMFAPFVRRGLI